MTIAPIGVPLIKKIILCLTHFSSHFTGDSDKKRKIIFIDTNDYSRYRRSTNKKNNSVLDALVSVSVRVMS